MIHRVALIADAHDRFQLPPSGADETPTTLYLGTSSGGPHVSIPWEVLDAAQLRPRGVACDLLRLAAMVYAVDLAATRRRHNDGWARSFELHVPVTDLARWEMAQPALERFLSFLTGDIWILRFRHHPIAQPPVDERAWRRGTKPNTQTVCLFSGGLDSFIGAVELTADGSNACLVGHDDDTVTKNRQNRLYAAFCKHRAKAQVPYMQFHLPTPKLPALSGESSKRSRSFLFLALGTVVADALSMGSAELIVPENGFIALNVPLATTRLGSLTTRTTHPYTLRLYRELLHALGLAVLVRNPYEFLTKGEMVDRCKEVPAFAQSYEHSISCAHPAVGRYEKRPPGEHCGYCVPCLIRRAAFTRAGEGAGEHYAVDVLASQPTGEKAHDLQAYFLAIESGQKTSPLARVLASGLLDPHTVPQYVDVYKRGLNEVAAFLRRRCW